MTRATIQLPNPLKSRIAREARENGMTMGAFIRRCIEQSLSPQPAPKSRSFFDLEVFTGSAPSDVSANVDEYLYGAKRDLH